MAAARGVDRERVRALCALRPALSYDEIGHRLGVSRQAVGYLARKMGIEKPTERGPMSWEERQRRSDRRASAPQRWRCERCGGQRSATVAHRCRPVEAVTGGLVWTRGDA